MQQGKTTSAWIFEKGYLDFSWLFLPGLLAIGLSFLISNQTTVLFRVYAFLTLILLDTGHCYSTLWRTYFHTVERKRRPWTYALVPVIIFSFLASTYREQALQPILFAIFFWIRSWHNIRQSYGVSKWYQQKNNRINPMSDFFLYTLCALPMIILVSGHRLAKERYSFLASHGDAIQTALYPLYVTFCISWILYEVYHWRRHRELNRVLSILVPAIIYGFLLMNNFTLSLGFALMISHAVAYFALVHVALKKTKSPWVESKSKVLWVILIPAAFAVIERFPIESLALKVDFLNALSVVSYTVFYTHVYYDTFLWRRSHPESALIYS